MVIVCAAVAGAVFAVPVAARTISGPASAGDKAVPLTAPLVNGPGSRPVRKSPFGLTNPPGTTSGTRGQAEVPVRPDTGNSPPAPGQLLQLPPGTTSKTNAKPGTTTQLDPLRSSKSTGTTTTGTKTTQPPKAPRTTATTNPPQGNAPAITPVRVQSYDSNRCIDVKDSQSGVGKDGARLQLWDCANTTNQEWKFYPDGTVRSLGMCMDLASAATGDGTPIQLAYCNGGWAQTFTLKGSLDLVNPAADKCVTADATGNGGPLVLRSCNGASAQKWHKF